MEFTICSNAEILSLGLVADVERHLDDGELISAFVDGAGAVIDAAGHDWGTDNSYAQWHGGRYHQFFVGVGDGVVFDKDEESEAAHDLAYAAYSAGIQLIEEMAKRAAER